MREQSKKEEQIKKEAIELKRKRTRENINKKKKDQEEIMKKNEKEYSEQVKKFNEGKDEFIKDYLKENPDKDYSSAHREFFREYNKMIEARHFRNSIISQMINELGISEKEAEEEFIKIIKKGIESQEEDTTEGEQPSILDREYGAINNPDHPLEKFNSKM